jgi:hypothetical protein
VEEMDAVNNPEDPRAGSRKVPFSKVLYIEQDDFRETRRSSITACRQVASAATVRDTSSRVLGYQGRCR